MQFDCVMSQVLKEAQNTHSIDKHVKGVEASYMDFKALNAMYVEGVERIKETCIDCVLGNMSKQLKETKRV